MAYAVNMRKGILWRLSLVSPAASHVVLGTGEGAHLEGAPVEAHGHMLHQVQGLQGDVLCLLQYMDRARWTERTTGYSPSGADPVALPRVGGGAGPPRWGGAADFAKVRQRDTCGLPAPMICE
jgi:hypothetical protein